MLATVTGTYRNGQIILDEKLPVKDHDVKVIVTIVEEISEKEEKTNEHPVCSKAHLLATIGSPRILTIH